MKPIIPLTRRSFLTTLGALSTSSAFAFPSEEPTPQTRYTFTLIPNAILTYSILSTGEWLKTATTPSSSPTSLLIFPDSRTLYVTNAVPTFNHRPTASVEAYVISPTNGSLHLLNRAPLALFALNPTHLSLTPDSRTLTILSNAGTVQTFLSLAEDGTLGRVIGSHKQIRPLV